MREIKICKVCNKKLILRRTIKKCGNLGCTQYNKIIRRSNNASRKKRQKKEILIQEEE